MSLPEPRASAPFRWGGGERGLKEIGIVCWMEGCLCIAEFVGNGEDVSAGKRDEAVTARRDDEALDECRTEEPAAEHEPCGCFCCPFDKSGCYSC